MRTIKLAYIGGGSRAWARVFMNDLALTEGLTGEIALYDIDRAAAEQNRRIGERINEPNEQLDIGRGYDHNWVLDKGEMALGAKARGKMNFAAELLCPLNGRFVKVYTTEPCLQVYTANWADWNQTAKGGEHLSFRCGCALETQHAPDSPNKPKWPTTFVKAGETYKSATEFRFGAK